MKERYKWPLYGIILGLFLSIFSRFIVLKQAGMAVSFSRIIGDPFSVWTRSLAPLVLGIVFFYVGVSRDRLIQLQRNTEKKNKELQKAMLEQSMRLGTELNNTMEELSRYTDQLDKIINNISAGVCLIDSEFTIEEGFNNALIDIFGNKDYLKNSIFNTVFSMIDNEKKKEAQEFLEQCFSNATASDSMLSAANPMEEFNYLYMDKGSAVPKIITTRIVRLKDKNNTVEKVLLLFNDVTVKRELEKSIKQQEEEYNKKYGIIVSLLGNDREVTRQFINDLNNNMDNLSVNIKRLKQNEDNSTVMTDIIAMVHSIKGEAFSLDFKALAEEVSRFESFLKENKGKILDLEMNLEIVNFYERISNERAAFDKIIKDLTVFLYGEEKEERKEDNPVNTKVSIEQNVKKYLEQEGDKRPFSLLEKELQIIKDKTADEKGKAVILHFDSGVDDVDTEIYLLLKESLLHLVRNSIDHGIETADERKRAGKPETGTIGIMVRNYSEGIEIEYTDDGRGFDVERIKEKAAEKNLEEKGSLDKMSNMDIIKLVFTDGFSTSDNVDMISGMGVGMSVVKKNIIGRLKGKLSITNKADRGILLKMSIPV